MSTSPHQIDLWRRSPSEDQHLEFKEAKVQYDFAKLCRYCVALANEGGGHLVLGVADKPPRPVVGSAAFPNLVDTAEKLLIALGFRVDLEEVQHPDGRVVVFTIPTRPRGTAYQHGGAYLMRAGEQLVPMTEDRLRRIFAEGAADRLEEPARVDLSDGEVLDLLDTETFFRLLEIPMPTSRDGVLERLLAERLIDRRAGTWSIRRLGALLLAQRLRDFEGLVRRAPRVVVYEGTSKLKTRLEFASERGLAVGFQALIAFILEQLPQNEVIEMALRTRAKWVPPLVVRELVANALLHQDFEVSGASPMIELYDDRMEISNPGLPVVPLERFIDGYQSRNERLADLMRRMRICEERGSGIDKVIQTTEAYQLPAPDFRQGVQRTSVIVYGPRTFEAMNRDDRIRACYQHCCLKWVMNDRMTNQSLRQRFGLTEGRSATLSQIIAATVEARLIKPDEAVGASRRFARYLPIWA